MSGWRRLKSGQRGNGVRRVQGFAQWVMLWTIPAIAITIAARQFYLSSTDDLSTWKGGGMGMFAGSENKTRYAKIYLTFADGRRQPLLRITQTQERLKGQALNYPNERNLRTLAQSVKATKWWASTTRVPSMCSVRMGERFVTAPSDYTICIRHTGGARLSKPTGGWRSNTGRQLTTPQRENTSER